ncbi:MAG: glycosyltransferase family 39 protein, partial [Planctomycetaceae bacterium]|nr:glycosyltransferase family 39 protein [Planctomycetaceae bacterium]
VYSSRFLRFDLFSVSPPLVKVIAGLPIVVIPHSENWEGLDLSAGSRSEFRVGEDFVKANSDEFPWLLTLARWACLPFTIAGALFARAFAREVFDSEWAGFCGLLLWCIEPNILGHSALITNDVACSAFGLGATWLFWRWLKQPTWERAGIAGLVFGIAQLTKMSWLMLFGLWPVLWLLWLWCEPQQKQSQNPVSWRKQACQLAGMLVLGLYMMNLGYAFDGTCKQLKKFDFVSSMLTGLDTPGEVGNRFRGSVLGELPVPLPEQYVLGFDLQKKDFEYWPRKSYLRGEWKQGGWWYYYLYGLWVKVPHGIQLLWLLAVFVPLWDWRQRHLGRPTLLGDSPCSGRDLLVLLAPGVCLFVLVSAQLEFNEHFRYVLPTIATLQVFAARLGRVFEPVGETAIQSQTTVAPA